MPKLFSYFLKSQFSNFSEVLQSIFFFISSMFVFSFFVSKAAGATSSLYAGFIFVIFLLTLNLRATNLFVYEYKAAILGQLLLHNYSPLQIIIARLASFILLEILPVFLLLPLIAVFFQFSLVEIVFLAKILFLSLPLLASILLLNAILLLPLNNKVMLLTVISFPLLIGPVIFSALAILSYFSPEIGDYNSYIRSLIYLDFIVVPVVILLASKALEFLYKDKFCK